MPNITLKKSRNESLKVAYKAALALAPLALESVCPKPVATLIEHFAGSTLNLFFEQEPTTCRGKTLKIIGDALAELFETERYEDMQSFFAKTDFRMDAFSAVENSNALAAKLSTRFAQYKGESPEEMYKYYPHISSFLTDLHHSVKARIDADEDLEKYWRDIKTANTVQEMNERDKAEQRKHEEEQPAHNRNADYIRKWNERCCLHKSEAQPLVTLETIYVMPEVQVYGKRMKVGDCVKAFLDDANQNILLLLGHGGYGKTSFVARMAAKTGEYTDRPLHIFRLREFADVETDKLYQHISAMAKLENNAVLVFDGLDELCMVGGENETEKSLDLLTQLMFFFDQSPSYKIIITSRPEYISAKKALERLKKLKISAKHFVSYCYAAFSERQRGELVDSIEKVDPALKDTIGCKHIRAYKDEDDEGDAIYGSPFLLYLICAAHEKLTPECFENRWLLFRTVFHDINPQPDYKKMQENTTGRGAVAMEHLDKLYRITSRLAYEIYKTGYEKQYFQKEEVLNIIRALYPAETPELISALGDCYALCAYFKQTENGAVEFAHNHVRDFFLCEYILQGLDDLYAKRPEMTAEECGKKVADWLSDNFKFTNLQYHDPILELMEYYDGERYIRYDDALSRIRFLSDASSSIKMKEVYTHVCAYCRSELRYIFNAFCANGGLHKYCYGYKKDEVVISVQTAVRNVMNNSNVIFHCILPKTATKNWWFNVKVFNFSERIIMNYMKHFVNADLCALNMCGLKLLGTDLRGADLRSADLRGADLRGADLSNANLKGARYNNDTNFTNVTPFDFDPEKAGMIKVDI